MKQVGFKPNGPVCLSPKVLRKQV